MSMHKYILASLTLHGLLMVAIILDWGHSNKTKPIDTDVLLLGPSTNSRVTAEKAPRQKAKAQTSEVQDPDALKTTEQKSAGTPVAGSEGSFGQGGAQALQYDDELAAWIKANKKYPKFAKRLGQECEKIILEFNVYPDGRLGDVVLKEKCQYEMLNQAALEAIKASSPFRPFPAGFAQVPRKSLYQFTYRLTE